MSKAKKAASSATRRTASSSRRSSMRPSLDGARERTCPQRLLDAVGGARSDALAVGKARGRSRRPQTIEFGKPSLMVVPHRDRFDMDVADPGPVERVFGRAERNPR